MARPLTGEPALIAALAQIFGPPPAGVRVGIGDDCAVLAWEGPHDLLWTMDTLVEGVHFDLSYTTLQQLGWKSLTVNLSDIAAMGGEPLYALLSLAWPKDRDTAGALTFGRGLARAAQEFGVTVIGGDTVAPPLGVAVTVAVLGRVPREEMVRRAGARVGDKIYVTGPLGESAAGLEVLKRGLDLDPAMKARLCRAHLEPRPQLQAGRLLARLGLATAMIDLSDGVATDLSHLCRAAGVGARLDAAGAPVSEAVRVVAALLQRDSLELALKGGEDYQLLFTTTPEQTDTLARHFAQAGLPLPIPLGEIIAGEGVVLSTPAGEQDITGAGYDHFRLDRRS